ncbi:MAG: glycosyltransferase family 2 protein [Rhodobacteraceae bacterium]|nr:glycosyltransferase family 2 protein [Paracoccaceae bacterium]
MTDTARTGMPRALVVIPTLNEEAHVADVIAALRPFSAATGSRIVVADGGSTDRTCEIVREVCARDPLVSLMHNPLRLQSAAINRAVDLHAGDVEWLIRIDAHSAYPPGFCETLIEEAGATGADVVAISVRAEGAGFWQRIIAAAQNSRFGNGGAPHRVAPKGRWVDHAHHALMRMSAFRAVGGYDPAFSHNEDAELDFRFRQAGFRIWLTARTKATYFPRRTLRALARQYFHFGRGRARNMMKHRTRPGPRQALVVALAPAVGMAVLAPVHPAFVLPAALWAATCMMAGIALALRERRAEVVLSGLAGAVMHAAWSAGFWAGLVRQGGSRAAVPA